jgi:molecular chaperone Hsp33
MIKKQPYGETLKEQHLASAKDRIYRFFLAGGQVRGALLHGTRMVNEMRANHELGILETLVLGHAYLGVGLMTANLKGSDRVGLRIECSGPVKGLDVESNAFGEVRGHLKQVPIPFEKPPESFNLSPFFGAGFIRVTRFLEDAKSPFTGQVEMRYGSIARDLAWYYLTSEQIPTAFNLSVKFDSNGVVTGAGGLFLQVMPEADEAIIEELESLVVSLPSIGESFAADLPARDLVREAFCKQSPEFLADYRVEFMCHCNREKIENMLLLLPVYDLKDIRDNGPFPLEIKCHHCNTAYLFEKEKLAGIYGKRYPDN